VGQAESAEEHFAMCGIAGFEIDGVDVPAASTALLNALAARGPDASWSAVRGSVALVETRLAVIDLSDEVVYPMANESGNVHLVFNGEIYDHEVLREELEGRGHRFRTHCDAEVVLHGYEQWGPELFPRLNGMFALAIVDERSGDVLLARDRLGIKPLVRTTGPRFAFSSDAIALVQAGLSNGELDLAALRGFASFHYVPPPATGVVDLVQVAPGTAIRRRRDGTEEQIVWGETPFAQATRSDGATLDEAEEALLKALRRQLVADVDVGVFLSGGLDSSLVLSAAVALGALPQAFSLGFAGHGNYDEADAASRVASQLGVPHHVAQFTASFDGAVNAVADAYDTPFADASAVAMIELAKLARAHVTVALSGTGGDDLFAGYYRHRAHRLRSLVGRVPPFLFRRRPTSAQGSARRSRIRLLGSYLARLAEAGGRSDVDQYLALVGNLSSSAGLTALRFSVDPAETAIEIAQRFGFEEPLDPSQLRAIQRFELRTYLPGDLLCKEDRATMAVGLEGRVPLLDDALLQLAERTPEHRMMSLRQGKIILRELAERFGAPLTSLKRGFAVPLGAFFEGPWRADAREWFNSAETDLVDRASASGLLNEHVPPASDLWMLATLIAWENRLKRARFAAGKEPTANLLASPS
jgi:asparagine synthase (glutamine-hydrolysing)